MHATRTSCGRHSNIPYVQVSRTSAQSSRNSASDERSSGSGPMPASITAAKAAAPRTDDSTARLRVRRSCRVATA